jgi:rhodanese-related sulfurtransferase
MALAPGAFIHVIEEILMFSRSVATITFAGILSLVVHPALATEDTPQAIPGGTVANVDQAKAMFDKGALFVDARVPIEYADRHIKGAINMTYKEEFPKVSKTGPGDKVDLSKLPGDKNKLMVFYCNGSPCWKGYKAGAEAIKSGYKQVYWFRDGMPAWESKGLPTE